MEVTPSSTPTSHTHGLSVSNLIIDIAPTDISLNDPHSWPQIISDSLRQSFIAENFDQTRDINLIKSGRVYGDGRTRYFNSSIFFRKLTNGETVKRTLLVYSETSGKVYCSACKLFSDKENNAFTHGFGDCKNVQRITGHKNRNAHR